MVFDTVGQIKWTLPGYYPVVATPEASLIASNSTGYYAFDRNGAVVDHLQEVLQESWTGAAYRFAPIERVAGGHVAMAITFAAQIDANASKNGTAVQPMASIEVRCRPVEGWAGIFGDHCFAHHWDPEKDWQATEGGEQTGQSTGVLVMGTNSGWGALANKPSFNPFNHAMYTIRNAQVRVVRCVEMVAMAINDVGSPYDALTGPNSNSGIATALQYCGLPNQLSLRAVASGDYVSFVPRPY